MNPRALISAVAAALLTACAGAPKNPPAPAAAPAPTPAASAPITVTKKGPEQPPAEDDLDDYAIVEVADPIQPVNRAIFSFNHGLYKVVLRPVAKGYEFVVPELLRKGIHNAYENVRFPGRFVNDLLQAQFARAGQETGKFVVNSTLGVGGLMRPADKFPALANVPSADTGQTFAKWGIDHGFYLVLPVLGPSSARDTVGLAGDAALNPLTWVGIIFGGATWTFAITSPDTVRSLPDRMDQYDTITKEAVDRYLAARSSYVQYRKAHAKR